LKSLRVYITGMTCAACSSRIDKGLRRLDGIHDVTVNLATAQAKVDYNPKLVKISSILGKIEQLGYGAEEKGALSDKAQDSEIRAYRNRFVLSFLFSIPLLWVMLTHIPGMSSLWVPAFMLSVRFQWVIATILQFYIGFPFYYGAYQALKLRTANMDVLVALSTSVAYFYSHYLIFHFSPHHSHTHLYFDTIAMVVTVILLGKLLESIAKGKALKDLNALYDLQIRLIRVMGRLGEEWIPAEQLSQGEIVIVRAGEWISADGRIVAGKAEVDESLLSGESISVLKSAKDHAYSGTRCLNGFLNIEASCGTQGTRLAQMIQMVEEAQTTPSSIGRKVDRVAALFVPFMILCAVITYFSWLLAPVIQSPELAIRYALAVLLIACPCALGLATPVSILIATALSAKKGILFKHGRSLETLASVNHILIDKTGTLTEGKPQLKAVHSSGVSSTYLIRMAAAIERYSSHPLAQAIVTAAERQQLLLPEAAEIIEIPGGGMKGIVEGKWVRIGHYEWMKSQKMAMTEGLPSVFDVSAGNQLYVSIAKKVEGCLILADPIRTEALETVRQLQTIATLWMVTGDQPKPASDVAKQVGIDSVYSACSPEEKADIVREQQREGRVVALIGDGMNDAAALMAADVGVAMGGGTNIAMQTGDVVLSRNNLSGILDAIEISKLTLRNIKQNLGFAVIYNSLAVPAAAMGYLDPRVACIGMAASSVIVVLNALRLQRMKVRRRSRE